jgi:NAD(P)-dependent dehydrogenase (short-subunit alcohol dehydrogenase family)
MKLENKVIVVTGGAGLLGRSFVRTIAEHGGIAVVADVDILAASRIADEISEAHPRGAEAEFLNIVNKESILALIDRIHERHGRIDALVNNAYPRNANYGRKLEEVTLEDFCENVNVHLGGYFLVAQQFGLFFKKQGEGNIVNMSSIYGIIAPRFDVYAGTSITMPVEYSAIKSAVVHLTRYFAQYYKGDGIRVNCLSPGGILDGQPELFLQKYNSYCSSKGMLSPRDVADALVFLLSNDSKYVTGQNIVIDDGFSL